MVANAHMRGSSESGQCDVVDRRQYQINPRLHAFNVQMHSESRYDILYVLRDFRISSRKF